MLQYNWDILTIYKYLYVYGGTSPSGSHRIKVNQSAGSVKESNDMFSYLTISSQILLRMGGQFSQFKNF